MKKKNNHLFTIFGFEINLNSILTTVAGFICVSLLTWSLAWIKSIKIAIQTDIPQLKFDVSEIQKEQQRLKKEYVPDVIKK